MAERKKLPAGRASSGGWSVPILNSGMTFRDIGSTGLRQYGGWVREEFLPQLAGRQAARTYHEMLDNSPVVGALIFAITQSMRKIDWRVQGASDKPEDKAEEEFVEGLMDDMSHTWSSFVTEALSMIGYGFAPHEIVYKRRLGRNPGADPANPGEKRPISRFIDGRIGWRKLPIRGQDTILKWFFGPNGEILGLTQQPYVGTIVDLPIEKLLLFRPSEHKGNPEGRSALRNSYRGWYFIKRLEEIEAIYFERMSGFPVMHVPNQLLEAAAGGDAKASATLAAYKKLITNVRVDEQMGVILPSDTFAGPNGPTSARLYELQLLVPQGGNVRAMFSPTIERHKLEILMTCIADFIQLGHSARGVQSLALSKVDMFFQAIEGWVTSIADVMNRYGLPRLWALNGLPDESMPRLVPDLAQRVDLDVLSNFVLRLSQSGMALFPDPELENYIRDAAGLPDMSEEGAYAAVAGNGEALKKMLAASLARRQKRLARRAASSPAGTSGPLGPRKPAR
jgi:hypothetical protein